MLEKIISYLKALYLITVTIFWFAIIDYDKLLENVVSITVFCLISGNLVLWSFYHIYKFCKVMKGINKEIEK